MYTILSFLFLWFVVEFFTRKKMKILQRTVIFNFVGFCRIFFLKLLLVSCCSRAMESRMMFTLLVDLHFGRLLINLKLIKIFFKLINLLYTHWAPFWLKPYPRASASSTVYRLCARHWALRKRRRTLRIWEFSSFSILRHLAVVRGAATAPSWLVHALLFLALRFWCDKCFALLTLLMTAAEIGDARGPSQSKSQKP